MKKHEIKPLKEELLEAVNKVLKDNNANLTKRVEKVVKKSIKKIARKTNKQMNNTIEKQEFLIRA